MSTILDALQKSKDAGAPEQTKTPSPAPTPTDIVRRESPYDNRMVELEQRRLGIAKPRRRNAFWLGFLSAGLAVALTAVTTVLIMTLAQGKDSPQKDVATADLALAESPVAPTKEPAAVGAQTGAVESTTPLALERSDPGGNPASAGESVSQTDPLDMPLSAAVSAMPIEPAAPIQAANGSPLAVDSTTPVVSASSAENAKTALVIPVAAAIPTAAPAAYVPPKPSAMQFEPMPKPSEAAVAQTYEVQGVIWDESNPLAVVNKIPVSVGDTIDGAEVKKINKKSVVLDVEGKEVTISIYGVPKSSRR